MPRLPAAERRRKAREDANSKQPFLKLPGEIRDMIYEFSNALAPARRLGSDRIYYIRMDDKPHNQSLAISQVCRTCRNEALRSFYGSNIFAVSIGKNMSGAKKKHWKNELYSGSSQVFRMWLASRPKEVLPFLRLIICDETVNCSHKRPFNAKQPWPRCWCSQFAFLVDFRKMILTPSRYSSQPDYYALQDCPSCWSGFTKRVEALSAKEAWSKHALAWETARADGKLTAKHTTRVVESLAWEFQEAIRRAKEGPRIE